MFDTLFILISKSFTSIAVIGLFWGDTGVPAGSFQTIVALIDSNPEELNGIEILSPLFKISSCIEPVTFWLYVINSAAAFVSSNPQPNL